MTDSIPVVLDPEAIGLPDRFAQARTGHETLRELVLIARGLIRARAAFEAGYIGTKSDRTIEVGGVTLVSKILRQNLEPVNKVFPYILTIGPELEQAAAAQGDLLKQYYLEEIANFALEQAADWLAKHIQGRYGLGPLSNMSPGSLDDWPITEQSKLFSIFGDTEKLIGVRLTDSMLMVPRKSISGILFPSEEGFVACQLCDRELCPGRKAAFVGRP